MTDENEKTPKKVGDIATYVGDVSGGQSEHPCLVTGINPDGSVDATVFFRRSPPAPRQHLITDDSNRLAHSPATVPQAEAAPADEEETEEA